METFRARGFLAVVLLSLVPLFAAADTEIRSVVVEGRGDTRESAIIDGLAEAVRQVNGVKLDLSRELVGVFAESAESGTAGSSRDTSVSTTQNEHVKTATKGAVRRYSIDSIGQDPDGEWSVHLRADVATYNSPGLPTNSRRKIVVWPFGATDSIYPFGGGRLSADTIREDLLNAVNRHFTQSRRFAVLSRQGDDAAALRGERTLITEESPIEEMAKLGQTLGADYLVCGSIRAFSVAAQNAGYGMGPPMPARASITIDYRIVTVATAQMKWADSVLVSMGPDEIAACDNDMQLVYRALVDNAGRGIVSTALENIYPVSVVSVNGAGELVLDQGSGLVRQGALFEVFRLGDELMSRNGESLGREETKIATIRIVRSDPKLSYGKIVPDENHPKGDVVVTKEDVAGGLVARPLRSGEAQEAKPERKPAPRPRPAPPPVASIVPTGPSPAAPDPLGIVYPVAVGLMPPIQTGGDADAVQGLDFGLFWARHGDVAGFAYGSFGHQALGAMEGWQLSSLYNESGDGSLGLQTTGGVNLGNGSFAGMEIAGLANVVFGAVDGIQISGLANLSDDLEGFQLSVANIAADVEGMQIGVYNQGNSVSGLQIGVVNMARNLQGVQIGLSNYVENSPVPWLPVLNICF